jgi:hypothetical protein
MPLPFVALGVGVPGSGAPNLEAPGPRGLAEPYECRLLELLLPPIAFCKKGLAPGEKGDPAEGLLGLPLAESGEFE